VSESAPKVCVRKSPRWGLETDVRVHPELDEVGLRVAYNGALALAYVSTSEGLDFHCWKRLPRVCPWLPLRVVLARGPVGRSAVRESSR